MSRGQIGPLAVLAMLGSIGGVPAVQMADPVAAPSLAEAIKAGFLEQLNKPGTFGP